MFPCDGDCSPLFRWEVSINTIISYILSFFLPYIDNFDQNITSVWKSTFVIVVGGPIPPAPPRTHVLLVLPLRRSTYLFTYLRIFFLGLGFNKFHWLILGENLFDNDPFVLTNFVQVVISQGTVFLLRRLNHCLPSSSRRIPGVKTGDDCSTERRSGKSRHKVRVSSNDTGLKG